MHWPWPLDSCSRWMLRRHCCFLPLRRGLHSKLSNVDYDIQKQFVIEDGFLQEHILRGTLASGEPFALHACAICKVEGGRITELREYLDTAEAKPLFA